MSKQQQAKQHGKMCMCDSCKVDRENERLKSIENAKTKICPLSIADSNEVTCKGDKCMLWKKIYFHEYDCLLVSALKMISEKFE